MSTAYEPELRAHDDLHRTTSSRGSTSDEKNLGRAEHGGHEEEFDNTAPDM